MKHEQVKRLAEDMILLVCGMVIGALITLGIQFYIALGG